MNKRRRGEIVNFGFAGWQQVFISVSAYSKTGVIPHVFIFWRMATKVVSVWERKIFRIFFSVDKPRVETLAAILEM